MSCFFVLKLVKAGKNHTYKLILSSHNMDFGRFRRGMEKTVCGFPQPKHKAETWPESSTSGSALWLHLPIPSGPDNNNICGGSGWNVCTSLCKHSSPNVTKLPKQPVIWEEGIWNQRKKVWGKKMRKKENGEKKKTSYLCCSMTRSSFIIVLNCLHSSATADRAVFSTHIVKVIFIFGYINIFIILIKYTLPFCFPAFPDFPPELKIPWNDISF